MEDYLYILLFIILLIESVFYQIFWSQAVANFKKKEAPLSFFNWGLMFAPEKFTEIGNVYRKRTLMITGLMIATISMYFVIAKLLKG